MIFEMLYELTKSLKNFIHLKNEISHFNEQLITLRQ